MIEAGSSWRLARSVVADDGVTLASGRKVWVKAVSAERTVSGEAGPRHRRNSSGLPTCLVVTDDGAHVAEVLEVDLAPA